MLLGDRITEMAVDRRLQPTTSHRGVGGILSLVPRIPQPAFRIRCSTPIDNIRVYMYMLVYIHVKEVFY